MSDKRARYWSVLNGASVLITQRSRVQIPPLLPGSAGQRADR